MARTETVTFEALPKTAEELRNMPQMSQTNPFEVAALTAAVICRYEDSPQDTIDMLNVLRGPRNITPYDIQFMRDRLSGKAYIARSYFDGAVQQNGYEPSIPYTVTVSDIPSSYAEEGFAKLCIHSSGAETPRYVVLRRKGDKWYLWDNFLMSDIAHPSDADQWA